MFAGPRTRPARAPRCLSKPSPRAPRASRVGLVAKQCSSKRQGVPQVLLLWGVLWGSKVWAWRAGCWHSMLHCGQGPTKQCFPGLSNSRRRGAATARGSLAVICGDKVARKPKKAKKAKKEVPTPPAQVESDACLRVPQAAQSKAVCCVRGGSIDSVQKACSRCIGVCEVQAGAYCVSDGRQEVLPRPPPGASQDQTFGRSLLSCALWRCESLQP